MGGEAEEPGPSGWNGDIPPSPSPIAHQMRTSSYISVGAGPSSYSDIDTEEEEEILREQEAEELELDLTETPQVPSRPILTTAHTHAADQHGTFHTSSSEIFQTLNTTVNSLSHERDLPSLPPLTRHTTYSSLPPSPRYTEFDYASKVNGGTGGGLDVTDLDLEEVLGRLKAAAVGDLKTVRNGVKRTFSGRHDPVGDAKEIGMKLIDTGQPGGSVQNKSKRDAAGLSTERTAGKNGHGEQERASGISLWDLLKDEAGAEEWDGWIVDSKWERIANFLEVPLAVEKITLFGALLCLDGFLYNFTVLPIRASFAVYRIASNLVQNRQLYPIPPQFLHSILRMLLLFIPTLVLMFGTDSSKMYHTVRGQDTIKLYVIFNALEIADRLCCAFGQDVLDTLFSRETLVPSPTSRKSGRGRKRQQARPYFFFALSLGYVLAHTLIYFYMLVSLTVAINSYDYTLLSLLISNQFVEIKGSVFKKFEKENLFQIMCADIVERFQLGLMLSVIALRNMIEMAGSDIAFLPKSFVRGKSLVDAILSPVVFVILSEMVVDWLKHAFITKFNHVRASVYGRFMDVLAKDVLLAGSLSSRNRSRGRNTILLDQSPLVARRLGFASIPLACLVLRIGIQAVGMLTNSSHRSDESAGDFGAGELAWRAFKWSAGFGVGLSAWGCLVALKVLLGLGLLSFSALRQSGMDAREAEDAVNDFGRSAVGESKEEMAYNKRTSEYLSKELDDLAEYPPPAVASSRVGHNEKGDSTPPPAPVKNGKKGKKWRLEEVERWTMVKRIW